MSTRGRAQQLVLKAFDRDGLEAYRFLFPTYELVSTVTAATPFSGGFMDAVTDFERRFTSLEHGAK